MENPSYEWIQGQDTTAVEPRLLVRWMNDPYLFVPDGEYGQKVQLKTRCKEQLKEHVRALPHIVEHEHETTTHACKHCGQRYRVEDYFAMIRHTRSTCEYGFVDRKCFCGRTFDTLDDAYKHYFKLNCLHYHKEKEEKKQKDEEKHKQRIEKMRIYNANRKPVSRCEVCDVDFLSKFDEERHMNGKQHLYKADPSKRPNHYCATCDSTFLSRKQMETHLQTRKHLKLNPPHSTTHTPPPQSPVCVPSQPSCSVSLQ